LVGGRPLRLVKLNPAAGQAVRRWQDGGSPAAGELDLAARLQELGLAVLRPATSPYGTGDVTVVVPVRDRPAQLGRTLAGIGPCAEVIVVDDGSLDPPAVAAIAERYGARLLTRPHAGPAAARNTGLAAATTDLVAFVDSDCTLPPGWLTGLLPTIGPDGVAAVAPRVVGGGGRGRLARFETGCGPLDLGALAGPVSPGSRVGHLPAAVLLCRRDPLGAGFDEALRVGEDVDLVWRLAEQGHAVRYEPAVVVAHATRPDLRSWLRQRVGYGRSAALLDARHPGRLAPVVVSRWSLPAVASLARGRPGWAAAWTALGALALYIRLPDAPGRAHEAVRLPALGLGWTVLGLADAAARPWLPGLLALAVVSPATRRAVVLAVTTRLVRARHSRADGLGVAAWAALRVADDLAYGTGLWLGALRDRRPGPVLPRVS
jgi:mycofactocin system glycosyltransferase